MVLRGAMYCRDSTDKQGDTVEHQVQIVEEFSKRMEEKIVFEEEYIFRDSGESAYKTTLLQRPYMKKMLKVIEKGLVDVVFFKGISRFARDAGESIVTAKKLIQRGVRVISIEENYDSKKDDPMMFQMHAVIAEKESRGTSIKVSLANKQRARNGVWPNSTTPIGYVRLKDVQDEELKKTLLSEGRHPQSLYPDANYSHIVQKVFELFVHEGYGRKRIVNYLNEQGYKTKRGRSFQDRSVADILSNDAYAGDIVYGKTRYDFVDEDDASKKVQRTVYLDKKDWAICRDAHPPLVSREDFRKAQSLIKEKEGKYNMRKRFNAAKHPLTGLLRCGICGAPMICQKRTNKKADGSKVEYRYYTCSAAHKFGRSVCQQKNIRADDLEEYIHSVIVHELKKVRKDENLLKDIATYNPNEEINKRIALIDHNIANRVKTQSSLLENKDFYDPETFRELNLQYKEEIIKLRKEKDDLMEQLEFSQEVQNEEDLLAKVDEFIDLNLNDLSVVREVFHEWINEVIVDGTEIKIDQKFRLLNEG